MPAFIVIIAIILSLTGLYGIVCNRNPLISVMSLVLIVNGAGLMLVNLDLILGIFHGQVLTIIILALAVFTAIFTSSLSRKFFREKNMADVDEFQRPQG